MFVMLGIALLHKSPRYLFQKKRQPNNYLLLITPDPVFGLLNLQFDKGVGRRWMSGIISIISPGIFMYFFIWQKNKQAKIFSYYNHLLANESAYIYFNTWTVNILSNEVSIRQSSPPKMYRNATSRHLF